MKSTSTTLFLVYTGNLITPLGVTIFPSNPAMGTSYLLRSSGFRPSPLYKSGYMILAPFPYLPSLFSHQTPQFGVWPQGHRYRVGKFPPYQPRKSPRSTHLHSSFAWIPGYLCQSHPMERWLLSWMKGKSPFLEWQKWCWWSLRVGMVPCPFKDHSLIAHPTQTVGTWTASAFPL